MVMTKETRNALISKLYENCKIGEISVNQRDILIEKVNKEYELENDINNEKNSDDSDITTVMENVSDKYNKIKNTVYKKFINNEITLEQREVLLEKARDDLFGNHFNDLVNNELKNIDFSESCTNKIDIESDIATHEAEMKKLLFVSESSIDTINGYLFCESHMDINMIMEASENKKRTSIIGSIINSIRNFITNCRAKFLKLIGSDKYEELEIELARNKAAANKKVNFDSKEKEMKILEDEGKKIEALIVKAQNGNLSTNEINELENYCKDNEKKYDNVKVAVGLAAGVTTVAGLITWYKNQKKKGYAILDRDVVKLLDTKNFTDGNKVLSDEEIENFKKLYKMYSNNLTKRNKLIMDTTNQVTAILDEQYSDIVMKHSTTSHEAEKIAKDKANLKSFSRDENKRREINKDKYENRSKLSDEIGKDHKNMNQKSVDEKRKEAQNMQNDIKDNEKYINDNSMSAASRLKNKYSRNNKKG